MAERPDLVNENNSTAFDYDNYILSMVEDGQSTENSSATDDNVKTDYRLSLPSSSQIQTYRLNINSNISERRKKFVSRIITIVAIFLLVVCILLVTLTLRLAHKIDELVRLKQLMPKPNTFLLISSSSSTTTTPTTMNNLIHRRRTQSSSSSFASLLTNK
jgi:preprotein translocase subunit SecG